MKLRRTKTLLLMAGVLSCLTACSEETVETYVPPLLVDVIQAEMGDFTTYGSTIATLEPSNRVTLMPGIAGEVERVLVSLGDKVEVGQLICVVDTENVEDQVTSASDAVERATDGINNIREGMLVKAPVSGYIHSIDETLNHAVNSSSQLAFISNQREMEVKIPFLEAYVDGGWVGKTAYLNFTDTNEQIQGKVTKISGSSEYLYGNISVNYVTIRVDNPGSITQGRKVAATVDGMSCSDSGTFENVESSPVICGLNGTVDEIYVSVGEYVTAGTTLFRITSTSVESQLKSAQDSLSDAVKARNDAVELLSDYQVRANVAGTVSNVMVKAFDNISQSSGVIEISTTDHMEITFQVSQGVIPYLYLGQSLQITSQGKEVTGSISELASVADSSSGLFTVKGVVKEDVLTGTSAQVEYLEYQERGVMTIPFEAVHFIGENAYVFVVENQEAVKKQVEIGRFTQDEIIITQGISVEDVLISSWSTQLRNGLAVTVNQGASEVEASATSDTDAEEAESHVSD